MQIFVKTHTGRTLTLDVAPTDTVKAVKLQLLDRERTPPVLLRARLLRGGFHLADVRTLADCGVGNEATLFLMLRGRGGAMKTQTSPPPTACAR